MGDMASFLYGENLSITAFRQQSPQRKSSMLGAICFSAESDANALMQAEIDAPCIHVPMRRLGSSDILCEVWQGGEHLQQGQLGDIHYRQDNAVVFGVLQLPEAAFATDSGKTPLQQATESAYQQIFALLDTLNYPYLLRFWNYIADINGYSHELERYRQFNLGRQDAFLTYGRDITGNVPAACALGSTHGPLNIAFLAGRVAPLAIENPRQISACQYPQQYGPRSPVFARASLADMGQSEVLFISGTASIVGHATLHPDDVVAQTHETMTNIEAVLAEANRVTQQSRFFLADLYYRIYVRHPADLPQIQAVLTQRVGMSLKAVYLQADVCRQDLLLEIEATAGYPLLTLSGSQG